MKHANLSIFIPHQGCPHQCSFCNQRAISSAQKPPAIDEIKAQCKDVLQQYQGDWKQAQIAFFGGSFTALGDELMCSYLEAVQPFLGEGKFASIRISTRPDAINDHILTLLRQYHVRSIELGAQSMSDVTLRLNQRGHTAQQVREAAGRIREYDFELGLQMMVGLPGDSEADILRTAEEFAALHPDTVRIYPTVILKDTLLDQMYQSGTYQPMELKRAVSLCAELLDFFEGRNINVIRLGLHAEETLQSAMTGGLYHPAFGELCQSRRFLNRLLAELSIMEQGMYRIQVHPKTISQAIGQARCNEQELAQRGYQITWKQNPAVRPGAFQIERM